MAGLFALIKAPLGGMGQSVGSEQTGFVHGGISTVPSVREGPVGSSCLKGVLSGSMRC